ncbi:MAG: protein-glutamate O-methyltransferase CheR [Woeseia sp.]
MSDSKAGQAAAAADRRYLPRSRREYSLGEAEFQELRQLILKSTGISVDESKRLLVYRRLSGRLRALELENFREYIDLLTLGDLQEREHFFNAVTTNKTAFFREKHHFDFLAATVLPALRKNQMARHRRLRIWSAGCSSGEEAHSIAMTLAEHIPDLAGWDAKILATDLDSAMIAAARRGIYTELDGRSLTSEQLRRFFKRNGDANDPMIKVSDELRAMTTFNQLNLINDWPMKGPFDVIFCRNVFIYFDKAVQEQLIDRFAKLLPNDGYLVLGHSETLRAPQRFKLVGKTIYRKVG